MNDYVSTYDPAEHLHMLEELDEKHTLKWEDMAEERDESGELTPLALALDSISGNGCDCGNDESGTCMACLCEAALRDLWEQLQEARRSS